MKNLIYLLVVFLLIGFSSCNKDSFEKQSTTATITHFGFDFSEGTEGLGDGEVVAWYPGGGSNPSYPSGLFYRNDQNGLNNEQAHYGTIDPDDVKEAPSKWDDPLVPMLVNHVYVFKCTDGYALVKVISLPAPSADPSDWACAVEYVFSESGKFN